MTVIDCFPFFNEVDLLEVRLHELDPVVDKFVIVESVRSFSFLPRELVFPQHMERFKNFLPKIEYVTVGDFDGVDTGNAWAVEHAQKQVGLDRALSMLQSGDLLIYGDCDEIPRAEVVSRCREMDFRMATLITPLYYYHLNCRCTNKEWKLLKVVRVRGGDIRHRQIRRRKGDLLISGAGWHFSYMQDIKLKIDSFAHTEYAQAPYNTPEHIERAVAERRDLFGRGLRFEIDRDLARLPRHVQDNLDRFGRYLVN